MPIDFPNPSDSTTYTNPNNGNVYTYANGSWSLVSTLSATKGGTGFASYTQGDILFGNASGTLSKLAASTTGYVLSTNGTGADPSWIAMSTSSGGAGTVATPGARYQLAGYYPGTGASVSGSSTFTNDTSTGIVSITHATGSTSPSFGALLVSGGVGIAGTLSYYKSQIGVAGTSNLPSMAFIGNTNNPVYLNVLENNSLSFEGYHGQLLSISPDLTTGYVFTVGDVSGIPLLRANANANITANEFGGNFGIGTTNPGYKLEVNGQTAITGSTSSTSTSTGALIVTGGVGIGGSLNVNSLSKFSNHLEIKTGNELRLYRSSDTAYTAIKSAAVSVSKTFTLPSDYGTAGQFLYTSDTSGTLAWTSDPVQVNTGAANQIAYFAAAGNTVSGSSTFTNDTSGNVITVNHTTTSTGFSSGALVVLGGVGISGNLRIGDTTNSTSTTTGSLTVRGGVGIAGTLYVGSGQAVTATATGDMVVTGGAGIGGSLRISGTTDATSSASGALIVSGGVGVAKNLYVGSQLSVSATASLFGAVSFLNELSTATFQNRIIKSGSIALSMSGGGTSGAVVQVWNANIKETGIGTGSSVSTIIPAISFKKQTFSATNANITYTKAANVYIEDAPDSSVTGATGTGGTNTVTILNSYALYVDQGKTFLGGPTITGGTGFTKTLGNGDIAADSGTLDTPGFLMYWANNKNFGLDTFGSTGATRVRLTRDLNESTGTEVFSVDVNGVAYVNSGYGQPAPTFGVRAWVNFDGGGTVSTNQTIRGSGNIASVYKNATGDYTITFTTAMPDANYCIQGLARTPGAADADVALNIKYNTTPATGSFQITTARYGSALLDCAHIHVSVIR